MIYFKTVNNEERELEYIYEDKDELENIWRSDDIEMYVLENDAIIYDVKVNGKDRNE